MRALTALFGILTFASLASRPSFASIADCDAALVKDTYSSTNSEHYDYRLATFVSKESYDQVKQNASANAVIYDVPMGANYDEFRENIQKMTQSMNTSLTHDQARNVLWTGLGEVAGKAYSTCISAQLMAPGLHLAVKEATDEDVTVRVIWIPLGSSNSGAADHVTWLWSGRGRDLLKAKLPAGETTFKLPRPTKAMQLVANYEGRSDSLVITPMPSRLSACQMFAIHPVKPSCLQNNGNRPGVLPNPRLMTVTITNTCKEPFEYKIWSGQEPAAVVTPPELHTQWISATGVLKPGEEKVWPDPNSDARLRIYAKPQACQNVPFPVPNSPQFGSNWDQ